MDNNSRKIKTFIMDIETKPQDDLVEMCQKEIKPNRLYKDPDKIKQDIAIKHKELRRKMSVDTDLADILCVGIKELGEEPRIYTLEEMERFFKENEHFVLVTYNGKGFDIPLLIKQGIKKGLKFPYKNLKEMTKRYSERHIDLMLEINERDWKSLDNLLQIYVGVSKTPIDFETATEQEIKDHCLEDLVNSEKLYNKFRVIL